MGDIVIESISRGKNIAIIPARGGSKGVPHKNVRMLKGFPLIAYSIVACQLANDIQRIVVSTDSEEIAEVARRYGAEVPFLRPAQFAGDKSGDIEFVQHAINWFHESEHEVPEYIIHMRPTTPLREPEILDKALYEMKQNENATSLRSGHKASESPYKWFVKNEGGYFESIVSGLSNDKANDGRQGFPDVYIPDGYIDIIRSEFVIQNNALHGNRMIAFESPVCLEVDTEEDFEMLEYQIEKKEFCVYSYLKNKYK